MRLSYLLLYVSFACCFWSSPAWADYVVELAKLRVTTVEPEGRWSAVSEIPSGHFLLAEAVARRPVISVITVRGWVHVHGEHRPFLIWATRNDRAVEQRNVCVEHWNAVNVFVGGDPVSAEGAPWAASNAELSLCFVAGEPRFRVRAEPRIDDFGWMELGWGGPAVHASEPPDVFEPSEVVEPAQSPDVTQLDAHGHVPLSLLPPVIKPLKVPYDLAAPAPPGYAYREQRLTAISWIGGAVFLSFYTVPLILAASSGSYNTGRWAVPVVGPFLVAEEVMNRDCEENCAGQALSDTGTAMILWVDSLVQVAGLAGIVTGLIVKKRWWERVDHKTQVGWSLRPLPVGAGSGLAWTARF